MFNLVEGDLFDANETYLVHQCNCVTNRSAHLAQAVFEKYPYADVYTGRQNHDTPGTILVRGNGKDRRFVVAMLGQYYPGFSRFPGKDGYGARLSYFKCCLNDMTKLKGDFAFPWRIGCGAAGGKWEEYWEALIRFEQFIAGNVTVYKLPGAEL